MSCRAVSVVNKHKHTALTLTGWYTRRHTEAPTHTILYTNVCDTDTLFSQASTYCIASIASGPPGGPPRHTSTQRSGAFARAENYFSAPPTPPPLPTALTLHAGTRACTCLVTMTTLKTYTSRSSEFMLIRKRISSFQSRRLFSFDTTSTFSDEVVWWVNGKKRQQKKTTSVKRTTKFDSSHTDGNGSERHYVDWPKFASTAPDSRLKAQKVKQSQVLTVNFKAMSVSVRPIASVKCPLRRRRRAEVRAQKLP